MSEEYTREEITKIQDLINSGQAWKLEGHIGRVAMEAIQNGLCALGEEPFEDAYGNRVPSRYEVKAGTPGSQEFVEIQKLHR